MYQPTAIITSQDPFERESSIEPPDFARDDLLGNDTPREIKGCVACNGIFIVEKGGHAKCSCDYRSEGGAGYTVLNFLLIDNFVNILHRGTCFTITVRGNTIRYLFNL